MKGIVSYLSQYFGNEEVSVYPRLFRTERSENLSLTIDRANCVVLEDSSSVAHVDLNNL
jgi:hypothetical protein